MTRLIANPVLGLNSKWESKGQTGIRVASCWESRCIISCGKDGGGDGMTGTRVGHGHLDFSCPDS